MAEQAKVPAIRFAGFTDPWEQRKLIMVAPLQRGFDLPAEKIIPGVYPVMMSNGIGAYHNEYKVKGPGVVTGRSGTIGNLQYVESAFWPHNTTLWVTKFYGNHPKFIYYLYEKIDLKRYKAGSGVPTLNRNDVHDTMVFFPASRKEQELISAVLTYLDDLITLHQRKYDKLVIFKKSMLEKMFPKDGESVPEIRFAGFTDPWEQRKASEVFQIVDDRGHPTLPVLSATQNQGMIYRDDSGRYIGHDESNEIGYKRVLPGDFVVHLRSFQGGFAHSQYEGITSPAYTVFRAKEPTSHSDRFWKHWFMSEHFIAGLSTVTYGIRDGRSISVDEFMNTFLAFPAVEEQAAISRLLDYLDDLITLHQRKRQWLKWLDEGGEGTHHDIDILVFKFADDMKISVLCGVHACMTKSLGHTGNRYAGKQQQRGMGVP